jgi:hypothetical protein
VKQPPILVGLSSFTAAGWQGLFCPRGLKPADYLTFYAEPFRTIEVGMSSRKSSPLSDIRINQDLP